MILLFTKNGRLIINKYKHNIYGSGAVADPDTAAVFPY